MCGDYNSVFLFPSCTVLQCIYATTNMLGHQDEILGKPLDAKIKTSKAEINANTSANHKGLATGNT